LNKTIELRATKLANYIFKKKATVRNTASHFGISKSTVYKDISERLKYINTSLYYKVKKIMETNKLQRHIRGGLATKIKYQKFSKRKKT